MEKDLKSNKRDLTVGSLPRKILKFALTVALTGILQQLFNAADVAVVGNFAEDSKNAMAAVGSNGPIIGLLINLFIGVGMGANVVIARHLGSKNDNGVKKAVHTAVLFAAISGVFLAILGEILAVPILRLVSVPDEVLGYSTLYLRILMAGIPFLVLYNFESAIFRSKGDTRTPLFVLLISGVINVFLNVIFVVFFKMSVAGVALATSISNSISSIVLFILLVRSKDVVKVNVRDLKIDFRELKDMVKIGVPAGLQGIVFSISNMLVQASINSLGPAVMAGSSAAFNIEIMEYYLINSFGQAATTFVSQNYGARNSRRCVMSTRLCLIYNLAFSVTLSGILLLTGRSLLSLFNPDPEIIAIGYVRIVAIVSFEFLNGFNDIISGTMRGYGYSFVPAVISVAGICGIRVAWIFTVFANNQTFATLMACFPVSWAVTAILMLIAYLVLMRTKMKPFLKGELV